jgi:DNA-binding NarL/FixJ family response regulator
MIEGDSRVARILIVDDSPTIRRMLYDILVKAGHEIVGEANTGVKGYLEYVRCKPDIVTMDLGMPTMNGLTAMSKILAPYPDARFVVISAVEEKAVVLEALQRGARSFLLKPFKEQQVLEAVSSVLKQTVSTGEFREKVRRHRRAHFSEPDDRQMVEEVHSPFDLETAADGSLHVLIHPSLSLASIAALAVEVKAFCASERPGIRFNLAEVPKLDRPVLVALDSFMVELHQNCGGVKVLAGNEKLILMVKDEQSATGKLSFFSLLLDEL